MNRARPPFAALALIVAAALISACGSGAAAETGTGSSGANGTLANAQKALRFAACMRKNGVNDFPDPGASGNFTIDAIANGSSLNTSTPAFKHAISTCKGLEPAGFTGSKRTPEQQAAALRFAECIREHGVKDFPDPVSGEPLVDTNRIPSAARPGGMSVLRAAMQKCSGAAAAAGVRR